MSADDLAFLYEYGFRSPKVPDELGPRLRELYGDAVAKTVVDAVGGLIFNVQTAHSGSLRVPYPEGRLPVTDISLLEEIAEKALDLANLLGREPLPSIRLPGRPPRMSERLSFELEAHYQRLEDGEIYRSLERTVDDLRELQLAADWIVENAPAPERGAPKSVGAFLVDYVADSLGDHDELAEIICIAVECLGLDYSRDAVKLRLERRHK